MLHVARGAGVQRRALSRTPVAHDVVSFSNRLVAREPFTIPWEDLEVQQRKKYLHHVRGRAGGMKKWYPEVSVTVSLGPDNTWIPAGCKQVMRDNYPYYYDKRADAFSIRTDKGHSFENSTEQVLDTFLHVLHAANKVATRDGSRYVFDRNYYRYTMPPIFRYREAKWLDANRTKNAYLRNTQFDDVHGHGRGYKLVGGYQPQDNHGVGGYHHGMTLDNYDYDPNAGYKMDPHFINPEAAEKKLGGVTWT